MASAAFDSEQQKLWQSLTPPASQPDTASLHDKEALSALGKSRDTAICILSDVEPDTEGKDDESRKLNSSHSYATRTSTPDYLDLTGTEHCATESEAAIGVVTAPTVSPASAEGASAWPSKMQVSHPADAEPSQKSCEMNHILTGGASAYQDVNVANPPASPESQPYPVAADGQQFRPVPVSDRSNMILDAVSGHGAYRGAQGHPDSSSTYTHSPRTASPAEVAQAPPQESEMPAGSSRDDAIPEAHTPSPSRPSAEPHQGQVLDDVGCASSDAKSGVTEAGSGSPSKAQVSSPSPSLHRSRRKSLQMHKTMQSKDGDADSESSGSEDGFNGLESQQQEEGSPSLPDGEYSGSEDDDVDDVHQGRKRRKVSKPPACPDRSIPTSSRSSRQRRSATHTAQSPGGLRTSTYGIESPKPSQALPAPSEASTLLAGFEEWSLENVSMKRITEDGRTTFQFQFEWPLCPNHPQATTMILDSIRSVATRKQTKRAPARRPKYSDDEDNFLIRLREGKQLGWAEIRRRFAQRYSERGVSGLQVHYYTKLMGRGRT
ncbi:hypothetical protein NW767_015408 [Fusarium falciforme]|uniref:Myb-like domain-containing protein n=1 Tax=Fusarium falciforme TaxID=195108 RepID=A0A9W8QUG8_9HYPO|nr:hypothetical protein NW767_015408 [Fusarium falciforme]KAJ4178423.1 hypothetical protein NW755_013202 [Fusarium falciforme]